MTNSLSRFVLGLTPRSAVFSLGAQAAQSLVPPLRGCGSSPRTGRSWIGRGYVGSRDFHRNGRPLHVRVWGQEDSSTLSTKRENMQAEQTGRHHHHHHKQTLDPGWCKGKSPIDFPLPTPSPSLRTPSD
eukprot:TRINITY_DN9619_c0_g1_i3.p1 TRINITY_DN9619_c0_g1~~TRINITY_DN9619_c0_g1_i3.p1  ORF type:complete len:129 (-),score=19.80 TRINITY_DN9619_c0_g1_i3:124-510(-)